MVSEAEKHAIGRIGELRLSAKYLSSSWALINKHARDTLRFDTEKRVLRKLIEDSHAFAKDLQPETTRNGLAVQTCAVFEAFLRSALEFQLSKFEAENTEVPEAVANANIHYTGKVFAAIYSDFKGRSNQYPQLANQLSVFLNEDASTPINKNAITSHLESCTFSGVEKFFKQCGLDNFWPLVAKETAIQRALKTKAQKETLKLIQEKLKQFLKARNNIAHEAAGIESFTEQSLLEVFDFYEALVVSTSEVLRAK